MSQNPLQLDSTNEPRFASHTMHIPSNPVFPQEIFDHILDHLSDDYEILATCSLVCRAWLPSCRYHFFSDIRLVDGTWPVFLDYDLTRHARAVKLIASDSLSDLLEHKFPNVTFLLFHLGKRPRNKAPNLSITFPAVTTLEISTAIEFHEVAEVVCSFPDLQSLTLGPVIYPTDSSCDLSSLCLAPSLHALTINYAASTFQSFAEWFIAMKSPPPLQVVRINWVSCVPQDLEHATRFLLGIGPALHHLQLLLGSSCSYL